MAIEVYTVDQIKAQGVIVAQEIADRTAAAAIKSQYENNPNTNAYTDADKAKLSGLEGSKFLGTFTSASSIPTVNAVAGSYADVDSGVGSDVARYIFDANDNKFVKQSGAISGETAASIKQKYESNANTNAFTDDEKVKLAGIKAADNITSWQAAFSAGLA